MIASDEVILTYFFSRQEFKKTGDLLNQNVPVGGCAYLKDSKNNRYIFYLVTKAISSGKPTMESLHKSLEELRRKCQELEVTKLAIPRIGCGLDRLDWDAVKYKINMVFKDVDIDICVYNFNAVSREFYTIKFTQHFLIKFAVVKSFEPQ